MTNSIEIENNTYDLSTPEGQYTYDGLIDPKELCTWQSRYMGFHEGLHYLHMEKNCELDALVAVKELDSKHLFLTQYAYKLDFVTFVFCYDAETKHYKQEMPEEVFSDQVIQKE